MPGLVPQLIANIFSQLNIFKMLLCVWLDFEKKKKLYFDTQLATTYFLLVIIAIKLFHPDFLSTSNLSTLFSLLLSFHFFFFGFYSV